jgi:hypothetical protein
VLRRSIPEDSRQSRGFLESSPTGKLSSKALAMEGQTLKHIQRRIK